MTYRETKQLKLDKPVLYLPVRPIFVPCDFEPKGDRPVKYYSFTGGFRYEEISPGQLRSVSAFVKREITRNERTGVG